VIVHPLRFEWYAVGREVRVWCMISWVCACRPVKQVNEQSKKRYDEGRIGADKYTDSVGSNSNGFLWWGSSKLWLATLVAGGALDEVLVAMLLGWAFQLEGVAGGVFLRAQWLGWTAVWTIGRGNERVWANLSSLGFECDSNCNNERVLYIYY
jgi:hypothetical protein